MEFNIVESQISIERFAYNVLIYSNITNFRGIESTGNFYIDDNVLKEEGITDFEQYAMEPGKFYSFLFIQDHLFIFLLNHQLVYSIFIEL